MIISCKPKWKRNCECSGYRYIQVKFIKGVPLCPKCGKKFEEVNI